MVSSGYNRAKKAVSKGYKKLRSGASNLYNKGKQLASKGYNKLKKGASNLYNKGKKLAAKGYNKLKKGAKNLYEKGKKVVKKVIDKGKELLNKKIQWKKTKTLANLNFKGDYKWQKTATAAKQIKGKKGLKISYKGSGQITLKYGYWFKFKMSVSFNFFWQIFKGNVHIEFRLKGGWDIGAYFNAKLKGQLTVNMKNILNYGKTFTFFIGMLYIYVYTKISLSDSSL